jgi:hypothetical protein
VSGDVVDLAKERELRATLANLRRWVDDEASLHGELAAIDLLVRYRALIVAALARRCPPAAPPIAKVATGGGICCHGHTKRLPP